MKQIVDKLNDISEKMGGERAETNLIVDALEEIEKVATSGGGGGGDVSFYKYTLTNTDAITIGSKTVASASVYAGYYAEEGTVDLLLAGLFYNNYFGVKPSLTAFFGTASSESCSMEFYLYNPTDDAITIGAGKMSVTVITLVELTPFE